jgi:hypothetical protein
VLDDVIAQVKFCVVCVNAFVGVFDDNVENVGVFVHRAESEVGAGDEGVGMGGKAGVAFGGAMSDLEILGVGTGQGREKRGEDHPGVDEVVGDKRSDESSTVEVGLIQLGEAERRVLFR